MILFELALGLALLVAGGELLVRGAVALAERLGVSPLLIGLTVVGFGTSTPELVTSLQAAFAGSPGIAVGNVVGSNVANILLILGVAAALAPFAVSRIAFRRDGAALGIATLALIALAQTGDLGRLAGLGLLAGLAVYLRLAYLGERRSGPDAAAPAGAPVRSAAAPSLLMAGAGIALTVLGARFLVSGAVDLAEEWGVSDAVIGLTVVAVGTSLPELVAAVVATIRRQGDLAFGNIVGSNIYNIFGILGATALIHPIAIPAEIARIDVWILLAATLALVVVAVSGWRATRGEGVLLLGSYAVYILYLALRGG